MSNILKESRRNQLKDNKNVPSNLLIRLLIDPCQNLSCLLTFSLFVWWYPGWPADNAEMSDHRVWTSDLPHHQDTDSHAAHADGNTGEEIITVIISYFSQKKKVL